MRDILLFAHIIAGLAIIAISILILVNLNKKSLIKPLSFINAALSWLMLYPSGKLYLTFYPATKTVILAGSWPWVHKVIMETKEHWGLLIPIIATVGAWLVFNKKEKESRKWWILLIIVSAVIGIMGRLIKIGALK